MGKFIFAFVALIAATNVCANPSYGVAPRAPAYNVAPAAHYRRPPAVVIQQAPLLPVGIVPGAVVAKRAPAGPLVAIPSNPAAAAAAATATKALNPGSYSVLAVPSYSILTSEPLDTSIPLIPQYGPSRRGAY